MENGKNGAAINQLETFANKVETMKGKELSMEEADALIMGVQDIMEILNTQA